MSEATFWQCFGVSFFLCLPGRGVALGRLTIFAKGNLDVHDSLHSLRVGGKVLWNGINEIVRDQFPETLVRLRHETWTRSDALLRADGNVPVELSARRLPLDPYPASAQFSRALLESDADALVLSIQPDVMTSLLRHRRDGYLFWLFRKSSG